MFRKLRAAPMSQFSGAVRIPTQPAPQSTAYVLRYVFINIYYFAI